MTNAIEQRVGDAVLALLGEEGYDAVDVSRVAQRSGLDETAVSERFADRRALLEVGIAHDEAGFHREVSKRVAGHKPTAAMVLAINHTLLSYDWAPWLELWALSLRESWMPELSMEVDRDFQRTFRELIEAGVAAGTMTTDDPQRDATAICALIDMSALQTTLGDPSVPRQYLVASVVAFTARLLGAELDTDLIAEQDS